MPAGLALRILEPLTTILKAPLVHTPALLVLKVHQLTTLHQDLKDRHPTTQEALVKEVLQGTQAALVREAQQVTQVALGQKDLRPDILATLRLRVNLAIRVPPAKGPLALTKEVRDPQVEARVQRLHTPARRDLATRVLGRLEAARVTLRAGPVDPASLPARVVEDQARTRKLTLDSPRHQTESTYRQETELPIDKTQY